MKQAVIFLISMIALTLLIQGLAWILNGFSQPNVDAVLNALLLYVVAEKSAGIVNEFYET